MLLRTVIFAAFVAAVATQIPAVVALVGNQPDPVTPATKPAEATSVQPVSVTPGSVMLEADRRGHFNATFKMNGKPVDGMVDTGASSVAINESTARRLGFGVNSLDFRYAVNTANGNTEAARIMLDRVEIGNVRVRDVEAMVLRDKALSGTLVGMSFLKKLKSFQVEAGNLKLVQ